jgi:signal transduction histidine kinase/ligand-binding sensor domain-containing protein
LRRHSLHIILLLFCPHLAAQQLPFTRYTPANGLVSNRARQLYQDRKGRLYITTYGGLSIYDGARFINYTTDNGLITSLVNDIVEMGDDSIWVIPNGPMIHCLVHGRLTNFETSDHFYPVINQLIRSEDGRYYAIADEGLFRFEQNRFIKIPMMDKEGREEGRFLSHAVTAGKYIFVLTDPHLDKFPGPGQLLVYDLEKKQHIAIRHSSPFLFIALSPDKEVWLSSTDGIEKLDLQKMQTPHVSTLIPGHTPASFIYFDHHREPWFSTSGGIYTVDPNTNEEQVISPANGLPTGSCTSIFQDREGTMWFANEETGVSKLADRDIQLIGQPTPGQPVSGFSAQLMYANPDHDSVWFFDAQHNQLLLLNNDKSTLFRAMIPPSFQPGHLIMGPIPYLITQHDIYRLTLLPGNRYGIHCIATDPLSSYGSCTEDPHGNLIVISDKLTTVLSGRVARQPLPAFGDQPVIDDNGKCWIVTRTNKLFTASIVTTDSGYTFQPLHPIDISALPPMSSRSLAVDHSGRVWIGSRDHGLFCVTIKADKLIAWKQYTVSDGLSGNFITSLLCDPDNTIWVGTSTGLDRISSNESRFTAVNKTAGFHDYPFVLDIWPAARGVHWATTRSGFLKITDSKQPVSAIPPPGIVFSNILTGNRPIDTRRPIDLSYKENNLHFYIAAPSFVNETQTRFQYRLEGGANSEWSPPSTRSDINFDNLPPGRYRLYTRALFFGRYPDPETHIDFQISPPWWQTTALKIAALALLTGIVVIGVRAYTRRKLDKQRIQLEKQQAVEKERTRIAMDMHDDLGAGLTRIKFITEDMAHKPGYSVARTDLEKLRTSSNELVDKMGEIIWAMNEKNNTLEDLLFYLRGYAADYCQENGLACEFTLPASIPARQISGQIRRNIFLILKETLHNIVKHAHARKVFIEINTDAGLLLQVSDDGTGFSTDAPIAGNGLLNMEFRASALNGTLQILHRKPATVLLKIPL